MIVACLKWTARPGAPDQVDDRFAGVSAADQAALEVALGLAGHLGVEVTAIAVGPAGAERALRDALACGASRAVRIDAPTGLGSADVGGAIAHAVAGAEVVVCGDYSLDRGTGSVPAFVAHHLGAAQALGLVSVHIGSGGSSDHLAAVRRLDGGRREVLQVPLPCVLSVEGSVATLRRAGLRASLTSRTAPVEVVPCTVPVHAGPSAIVTPFRPRARVMPAPSGDDVLARLRALTDTGAAPARGEVVTAPPDEAAERIVRALREWGYLD
jgi:electron transfer flavoprotein beta subunit